MPGFIRPAIAIPLQRLNALFAYEILSVFGTDIIRYGSVLEINGVEVGVAEACNGMRSIYGMILVCYAVAFATQIRASARIALILLSPLVALSANLVRLLLTVLAYGYTSKDLTDTLHDMLGWAMICLAFGLVWSLVALARWLMIPIDLPAISDTANPKSSNASNLSALMMAPRSGEKPITASLIVGLVLLILFGLNQAHVSPKDATDYHQRVREAVLNIPREIGPWTSTDQEATPAAVELLRPNVMLSRRYTNTLTGESITVLLVHSKDATDLVGHYPPICYPNQGWRIIDGYKPMRQVIQTKQTSDDWATYAMTHESVRGGQVLQVVYHLMLSPNGTFTNDMSHFKSLAFNRTLRYFGGAQVQIIINEKMSSEDNLSIEPILEALKPVYEEIFDSET